MKDAYSNGDEKDKIYGPCIICKKMIINAGLTAVYMREEGVGEKSYTLEQIKELLAQEERELREKFRTDKPVL